MRKYGLIGYPLGHSFSKSYFTAKFLREGIDNCIYENFPIPDLTMLPDLLLRETELFGLNVTIPYKSEIFPYIDFLDPEAREIGAVNVLKIKRTKERIRLYGFNSDITGVAESLSPYLGGEVRNAIVLGTGGSSLAVRHVLKQYGWNIMLVSRTKRPGILDYSDINAGILLNTSLIVNTTPLGMFPHNDTKPEIDYSLLNKDHVLFDLVYNPEMTLFLRSGMQMGCSVITGLKMLHSQAERAWHIWNNENM